MHILITRPQQDAVPLKLALEKMGHTSLIDPMLRIVPILDFEVPPGSFQCMIITSRNALDSLLAAGAINQVKKLKAAIVGENTRARAVALGIRHVVCCAPDANRLAEHLKAEFPNGGRFLYFAGKHRTSTFEDLMLADHFAVKIVEVYRAESAVALSRAVHNALIHRELNGAVFFSQRTARTFLAALKAARIERTIRTIAIYCLSEKIASEFRELSQDVRVANEKTLESVIQLIGEN